MALPRLRPAKRNPTPVESWVRSSETRRRLERMTGFDRDFLALQVRRCGSVVPAECRFCGPDSAPREPPAIARKRDLPGVDAETM
jgi:hypothetical protein